MAATRWIRLDVGWEDSAWLDALDGISAGCWPRLLCWVKRDGIRGRVKRPSLDVAARRWRVPPSAIAGLEAAAINASALVVDGDDWVVVEWARYQEHDGTSAERSKRYRQSKSRLSPSRRDTVSHAPSQRLLSCATETETKEKAIAKKKWKIVPDEWQPTEAHHKLARELGVDLNGELAKFREWEFKEPKTDADRAFNRWLRNAKPSVVSRPAATNPLYADLSKLRAS